MRVFWFLLTVIVAPRVAAWINGPQRRYSNSNINERPSRVSGLDFTLSLERSTRYFFSSPDIPILVSHARSNFPLAVDAIVADAVSLVEGEISTSTGVRLNSPLLEDRIRSSWVDDYGDQEHLFYLNRFGYAETLAKAYVYTGDEQYVRIFADLLDDWKTKNPPQVDALPWESYSVSERICNWLFAYHLLQESDVFREYLQPVLLEQLAFHACFLADRLEIRLSHNHLINNARALFIWGTLSPDHPEGARLADFGWQILLNEISRQFHCDGMLREQSTHYQLLLTRTYIETYQIAIRNDRNIPPEFRTALQRIVATSAGFLRVDGTIPLIGDVSPDIECAPLGGMVAVGNFLLPESSADSCGFPLTEYAMWRLGADALAFSPSGKPKACPLANAKIFPGSGFAVIRADEPPRLHLTFRCDPTERVAWHGHEDILSIDIWWNGYPFIVDPGNYSYTYDAWYRYFTSCTAHNTLQIDGHSPLVSGRFRKLWGIDLPAGEAGLCESSREDSTCVIEGFHFGYWRLPNPVRLRRRLSVVYPDGKQDSTAIVRVTDYLEGSGRHQVESFFHFGLNELSQMAPTRTHLGENDFRESLTYAVDAPDGRRLGYVLYMDMPAVELIHGRNESSIQGWVAPGYGQKQAGTTAIRQQILDLPTQIETVIWLGKSIEAEVDIGV